MAKKQWSDLSPGARRLVVVGGIVELVLTVLAMRDLGRRSRSSVRGPKWLWRLLAVVQPFGPIAYFLVGRRGDGSD